MGDLVEETVRGIRARLKELAPAKAEYERLAAAYEALGGDGVEAGARRSTGGDKRGRRSGARPERARSTSRRSAPRANRGQNKAAVFGVISERPGVTVSEIAQVTRIAKPLIYNSTRAGVERGELVRVALPGGQQGFMMAQVPPASERSQSGG
jgi:hypothetical protein